MTLCQTEPSVREEGACAVEAFGVVRFPVEAIAPLRKNPGPPTTSRIPNSLMKHADHQTVLAISAVLHAAHDFGWSGRSFEEWGVIAAPRFLARLGAAASIERYRTQGAPTVSPLIIPTMTLNAVAGALSLAIQSRGFNYGVGGSSSHLSEALLTGLAARWEGDVPGIWVVATGFDPEPAPDELGVPTGATTGYAAALALTPEDPSRTRLNLCFSPTAAASVIFDPAPPEETRGVEPLGPLLGLIDFLLAMQTAPTGRRRWSLGVEGGGVMTFDDDPARAINVAGTRGALAG